jgi:protein TonB
MNHKIALMSASAPSLSPEKAARSFRAERIPLAPPLPDRDVNWRWGVAIAAALLLHLGVLTAIDDGFLRKKSPEPAPIPVEIVTEPPKPPPPAEKPVEKPVEKPPEQQKPPEPQQPQPDRSSGGDQADKAPGTAPSAPAAEDKPPPPAPPPPAPEPPAPTAAPALPAEASSQAVPLPPASSPRDTQQALIPPPVPAKKPPTPPERQVTSATPPQPQASPSSTNQDLRLGEGGGDKYLNAMRDQILRHMVYPPTAELFHLVGTALYQITINRQGQLLDARLVRTTGYEILDKAGFQTIKMSAPFDPFPPDLKGETITLDLLLAIGPPNK